MLPTIATGNVGSALAGEYEVANSCRFDDASSDHLIYTASSESNRRTYTISFWTKRANLGQSGLIGGWESSYQSGFASMIYFNNSDQLEFDNDKAGADFTFNTDMKFRDVSAWYHIVIAIDTTQSTEADRQKVYVNGSQVDLTESSSGFPTQNYDTYFNKNLTVVGSYAYEGGSGTVDEYSGYMAEVVMIDGQQLNATSFGEFDSDSPNIWKPKDVSGLTFGTNGFYLDFENASSLGADVSGNGNNFTVNNLTSIDQSTDTCTNNFATLNPLLDVNATPTFTEGNLVFQGTGSTNFAGATIPVSSGKWYVEVKATTVNGSYPIIGVIDAQSYKRRDSVYFVGSDIDTNNPSGFAVFSSGDIYHNDSNSYGALGTTYTSGDIIGLALDMDSGTKTLGFYKNGSLQTTINLDEPPSGAYMFASGVHSSASSGKGEFNFGNPPFSISSGNSDGNGYGNFEFAVPSGYFSLCTKNLAEYG